MLSILGFLIILGPLVIVHEFGHYFFARVFGVKAEIFSVGFGPRLWSRQCGETELRISAVPLGGYVKLLGEERDVSLSSEEQKRALHRQAPWKRFFIFFGGPLFNFIFAIFVFMAILLIGEPQLASVVGRVVQGSQAAKAGFQSGDRIVEINHKPVKRFEEVINAISDSPSKPVEFEVLHPNATQPALVTAVPSPQSGFSVYGEATNVGEIDGLLASGRATQVGISNPASEAAKAGVHTGDQIASINGTSVTSWEQIESLYQAAPAGSQMKIQFHRAKTDEAFTVDFIKSEKNRGVDMGSDWGLYSSELFVEKTVPKSPAEGAGVAAGDRLIGVGNQAVHSFFELKDAVQRAGEQDGKVTLNWERAGKSYTTTVTPTATSGRDPILKKTTQYTVGIVPMLTMTDPVTMIERIWNPFTLVFKATERMVTFSWRNLVSVRKMITGDVSVATLGGPILIGKIAGESLSRGLIAFLTTMAILSIGLGVLNILPVPVLDGGHLLLLGIESIRGKPLTMRQMEIIQGVGLSLVLLLMVIVIRNDLTRLN